MAESPTFIDLCCGAGGLSCGLMLGGLELQLGVEKDVTTAGSFASNFGEERTILADIAELAVGDLPACDVLVCGLPSDGHSGLRRRQGVRPSGLWREFVRILHGVRPRVFLIEAVPGFLRSSEFEEMSWMLARIGYSVVTEVVDAADFGVPQQRKRAIMVGLRAGVGNPARMSRRGGRIARVTLRAALKGIPFEPRSSFLSERWSVQNGVRVRGPFRSDELHFVRHVSDVSLQRANSVPPGGSRVDIPSNLLPAAWRRRPNGFRDAMGRLSWDSVASTIRREFYKPEKGRYLHPQWDPSNPEARVNRSITHWEAARIQTFPDNFLWCGAKVSIGGQIGEATPVLLARELGVHLREILSGGREVLEAGQDALFPPSSD